MLAAVMTVVLLMVSVFTVDLFQFTNTDKKLHNEIDVAALSPSGVLAIDRSDTIEPTPDTAVRSRNLNEGAYIDETDLPYVRDEWYEPYSGWDTGLDSGHRDLASNDASRNEWYRFAPLLVSARGPRAFQIDVVSIGAAGRIPPGGFRYASRQSLLTVPLSVELDSQTVLEHGSFDDQWRCNNAVDRIVPGSQGN